MKIDDKINIRLIILSIFLAFVAYSFATGCATTRDCSKYSVTDVKMCKCIRDNGDYERAKKCSDVANKLYREKARKDCMRKCYDMIDCERCLDI